MNSKPTFVPSLHGRRTADYSPTMKGSKEESRAIQARREMLSVFASIEPRKEKRRKTWTERMMARSDFRPGKPRTAKVA